jgi:DnaJ-class molecular chaperone
VDPRKDYYKILGVSEDADAAIIKKAYRDLAKQYHPDKRGGDRQAELKFKEISEAYSILNNPQKRKEYNMTRNNPFPGGGNFKNDNYGTGSFRFESGGGFEGFSDIFNNLFSGGSSKRGSFFNQKNDFEDIFTRSRTRPARGRDIESKVTVGFEFAVKGGETLLVTGDGKKVKIKIPAGTEDGKRIKMSGYGQKAPTGGMPGDMYVTIQVAPHPKFERKGNDIYSIAEINMAQALLGSEIYVNTVHGKKVKLKIPPGTSSGKTFRLAGMGINSKSGRGSHNVKIRITVPPNLSSGQKKRFKEWAMDADLIK